MAKQLVNPLEQHVEKAALGIAGVLLIAVIARYLVTSPNQLDLGGVMVTPKTIDQHVKQKALEVAERIKGARVDVESPEPLFAEFASTLTPFASDLLHQTLPPSVPFAPDVPIIDPPDDVGGNVDLVAVVPLGPPVVVQGRSTMMFGSQRKAVNWVTVSAVFDVTGQEATQVKTYGAARKEVIFGPAEIQRRARRSDGSWSDADWTMVEAAPVGDVPRLPRVELVEDQGHMIVPRMQRDGVSLFLGKLRLPETQLDILRPMFPMTENGSVWEVPVIGDRRNVLVQDDYFINNDKPPSNDPLDRYNVEEDRVDGAFAIAEETPEEKLGRVEQLLDKAWTNKSIDQAVLAYNLAREVADDKSLGASLTNRADRLVKQSTATESDIKFWAMSHGGATTDDSDMEEAFTRKAPAKQQVWAHDSLPGSVESDTVYEYRIRPTIYNRMAAEPTKFRQPQDSLVFFITGPWSVPIEVTVPADRHYFIVTEDKNKTQVGVELYRWFEGDVVKSTGRLKVGVGQPISGESRVAVRSPDDPAATEFTRVNFDANATVVDIDFDRPYRERKRGRTRQGFKLGAVEKRCSVTIKGADGRLSERFVLTDKGNPRKKELEGIKYRPQSE